MTVDLVNHARITIDQAYATIQKALAIVELHYGIVFHVI